MTPTEVWGFTRGEKATIVALLVGSVSAGLGGGALIPPLLPQPWAMFFPIPWGMFWGAGLGTIVGRRVARHRRARLAAWLKAERNRAIAAEIHATRRN